MSYSSLLRIVWALLLKVRTRPLVTLNVPVSLCLVNTAFGAVYASFGVSGLNSPPAFLFPGTQGTPQHPVSSCSVDLLKEEGLANPSGLVPTAWFSAGSHHGTIHLTSWKLIIVLPCGSPCLPRPRSISVCFHPAEILLLLFWCGLISSNGVGGCLWTASCSCPLLANSCIGG
jgi:hypothetical protein